MENLADREIVVGLDIGTTKIAVIVGSKNEHGKLDIFGFGRTQSHGVRRGEITNLFDTEESIKKAVNIAGTEANVEIKVVNVGIAGQHIKSVQHKAFTLRPQGNVAITEEEINSFKENIKNLAMETGEKIIDIIPQEYFIDNQTTIENPVGMLGQQIGASFHIVIAKMAAVANILKCVEQSDLVVSHTLLQPLASSESVLTQEEKKAGVVLVDIGGGTTDVAIYLDGIIRHTAVIPFGGEVVTKDIVNGCKILDHYAEELKIKYGSALADEIKSEVVISIPGLKGRQSKEITQKNLAHIIQARMKEVISLVNDEINYTDLKDRLIGGIVLTGGGALLNNIDQLTQFITGMETRIGYPNEHISGETDPDIASPMYSTAIGLVLLGIKRDEKEAKQAAEEVEKPEVKQPISKDKKGFKKIYDSLGKFFNEGIE